MAKISFLLPVYNGEEFLLETLESLVTQEHDDFDIFLIDDGSTDTTAKIVEEFNNPLIKYHYKPNGGLVDALNYGLHRIDSEYVARIDADDTCFPHRLRSQLEFMEFTMADAVSSAAVDVDQHGKARGISRHNDNLFNSDPSFYPAREPYLPHPFMMVKLAVFHEVGLYRDAHLAEDSDLCWRLNEAYRIALQSDALGRYRIHLGSISNASLVSGRVQAFYSQLAALNCVRRSEGREELAYHVGMKEAKVLAQSLEALFDLYKDDLDETEYNHIAAAAYAKLFDLAGWREHPIERAEFERGRLVLEALELNDGNARKIRGMIQNLDRRITKTAQEAAKSSAA